MLSFKRRLRDSITIVFHEKARAPKRFLFRGIVLALLFHLVILFLFQIRVRYVDDTTSQEAPTVFLDTEDSFISLLTEQPEDISSKITKELHFSYNPFVLSSHCAPILVEDEEREGSESFQKVVLLPWSLSDSLSPSIQIIHSFPLKITLHGDLRPMTLLYDGSFLFKKASYESLFATPFFAESQPHVDFLIEIQALETKITKISCIRELIDKRLQEVAIMILSSLRFAPCDHFVKGKISLQFSGTFDTISPFLRGSYDRNFP